MFKRKSRPANAPDLTSDEALSKLEQFCLFRERCSSEVWEKIRELRLSKDLGDELFEVLKNDRFFDDQRFAEIFARGKFRSNQWGKIRIKMELNMRKISPAIVAHALDSIDPEAYEETLRTLVHKKMQQWQDDPQARQKAAASVIRAGFESDLVFAAVKNIEP